MNQTNFAAVTSQLISPCRFCVAADQDKNDCMHNCKALGRFRMGLNAYHQFTLGAFVQVGTGEHTLIT